MKGYKVMNKFGTDYGIIVAPNANKAKYRSYLGAKDVWDNVSITDFRVVRAPEYDGLTDLSRTCYTKEWADHIKEESAPAIAIEAESPERSEDLQRIARAESIAQIEALEELNKMDDAVVEALKR